MSKPKPTGMVGAVSTDVSRDKATNDFPRQKMRFSAAGFYIFRGVPRRCLISQ